MPNDLFASSKLIPGTWYTFFSSDIVHMYINVMIIQTSKCKIERRRPGVCFGVWRGVESLEKEGMGKRVIELTTGSVG